MRGPVLALIGVLAASWTSTARADDIYRFVSEYVRELGAFEKISADAEQKPKAGGSKALADCIRYHTRYQQELGSAVETLQGMTLKAPADDVIPVLIGSYQLKIALHEQWGDICAKFIPGPQLGVDYAKLFADAQKIKASLESDDQFLVVVAPLVSAALVDKGPDSQNHLVITREQRSNLLRKLGLAFGNKLNQDNPSYTEGAAAILKNFLAQDYKCSDDPR